MRFALVWRRRFFLSVASMRLVQTKKLSNTTVNRNEPASGCVHSVGDVFLNGAQGMVIGPEFVFRPEDYYSRWTLEVADHSLIKKLLVTTGWQSIPLPRDLA
eukprot:TRINITY_DN614_c0_g1_i5.p3 TRINITY_DN614_c0_g1~~TRINITY_DN614_c0_g1_i5.p3  ORF type:complete len:102 (-),score=15.89 TRINITY_DN614_c0_g1_i5:859-1164(-)